MPAPSANRAVRIALLGVVALVVLVWWIGDDDTAARRRVVRPSETQRARAEAPQPTPPPAIDGLCTWVRVAPYTPVFREGSSPFGTVGPEVFFPTVDEAPLPDHPVVAALETMLDQETAGSTYADTRIAHRELVGAARDDFEASMADPADPWALLVQVELARRAQRVAREDHLEDALLALELDPLDPDRLIKAAAHPEGSAVLELPPERSEAYELAAEMVETHPDHPAAEFARLYVVEGRFDPSGDAFDPEVGSRQARALLTETEDALVARAAASAALRGGLVLKAEELDALAFWWGDLADTEVALATLDRILLELPVDHPDRALWRDRRDALVDGCRCTADDTEACLPLCEPPPGGVSSALPPHGAVYAAGTRCAEPALRGAIAQSDAGPGWRWRADDGAGRALAGCMMRELAGRAEPGGQAWCVEVAP